MMESDDFKKNMMFTIVVGAVKKKGVGQYWCYCLCNSLRTRKLKRKVKLLLFLLENFSHTNMIIIVVAIPDILIAKRAMTLVGCTVVTKGNTGFIMGSLANCLILVAAKGKSFQKEVSKYQLIKAKGKHH